MKKTLGFLEILFRLPLSSWSGKERTGADAHRLLHQEDAVQQPQNLSYFDGNGGAGITIAVLEPSGNGLDTTEHYVCPLVQNSMIGDLQKFSAMTVIDRQSLDKVLDGQAQPASGNYTKEQYVRIGRLANARYILTGSITKLARSYSVEFLAFDTKSGARKASYPLKMVTSRAFENLSAIKEAAADVFVQLGVQLTGAGLIELIKPADSRTASAETALAKGIVAQKSGSAMEALSRYYEAEQLDPSLAEAARRKSALMAGITSGGTGQHGASRANWHTVLREAAAFFKEHVPFEIIYDAALTRITRNYDQGTAAVSFHAKLIGTIGLKIIYDLNQSLEKFKTSANGWDEDIDFSLITGAIPYRFNCNAVLINEAGEAIGRTTNDTLVVRVYSARGNGTYWFGHYYFDYRDFSHSDTTITFEHVAAHAITGRLTISIVSVHGVKAAGECGYIGVSAEDFPSLEAAFKVGWRLGGIKILGYNGNSTHVIIPPRIGRWIITAIGDSAFRSLPLSAVTIPDGVTDIGTCAFYSSHLVNVTIPASVTYIGNSAFAHTHLTGITMPAHVRLNSSFDGRFDEFYNNNGGKAGTYIYDANSGNWHIR